jgi:hypothetical protein
VKKAATLERSQIALIQPERGAQLRGVVRETLAVPVGRRIARLDRGAQAQDDRLGRFELVGVSLEPDERLNARVQLRRIEWLDEEIVASPS